MDQFMNRSVDLIIDELAVAAVDAGRDANDVSIDVQMAIREYEMSLLDKDK